MLAWVTNPGGFIEMLKYFLDKNRIISFYFPEILQQYLLDMFVPNYAKDYSSGLRGILIESTLGIR